MQLVGTFHPVLRQFIIDLHRAMKPSQELKPAIDRQIDAKMITMMVLTDYDLDLLRLLDPYLNIVILFTQALHLLY